MNVRIEQTPARRVAYLRGHGPYPQVFPKLWPRFAALAGPLGLFNTGGARMSIMHDNSRNTPSEQLRGDAAIEVNDAWTPQGGLDVEMIPAGRYAVAEYQGPYDGLKNAWSEFFSQWLPTSGHRLRTAPSYEIYLNDPTRTPPQELRTNFYVPIE